MHRTFIYLIISFTSLCFISCEKDKYNAVDIGLSPPFLSHAVLDKYLIDSDSIKVNGHFSITDTITISNRISVFAENPNGLADIKSMKYDILYSNSQSSILEGFLYDNGSNGDLTGGDGEYAADFSFRIPRIWVGLFSVRVIAENKNGLFSNELILGFNIKRFGKPPIVFNLNTPDTVSLPSSGSKIIRMCMAVSDSNGLSDIKEVFFRSLDSSDPTNKYYLFDNGNITTYGDSVAGDGIFSIKIELPYNMNPKPYRFEFQAKDFTELFSNKILHTVYVIRP
jgi:hypothetical protein